VPAATRGAKARGNFVLAIIATVIVLDSVLGGCSPGGGSMRPLWHPLEILIICGSALGAFPISNPMRVVKDACALAIGLVKGARYGRQEYIQLLKLVYDILVVARKAGPLAIEKYTEGTGRRKIFKIFPVVT
jgi:chemotaxis protein MotA